MNKPNKTYNATDFANYHAGTMPMADMHALEKAALEDDFLADALDGYTFTKNATEELIAIKESMQPETAKIIPIAKANNNWLKYAAAAVIVLGLGTLFFKINNNNKTENIAKVNVATEAKRDSSILKNEATEKKEVVSSITQANGNLAPTTTNEVAKVDVVVTPVPGTTYYDNATINSNLSTTTNTAPNTNFNYSQNQLNNGIFQNNVDTKTGGPKQLALNKNTNNQSTFGYNGDDRTKFKTLTQTDSTNFSTIAMNDKVAERVQATPVIPAAISTPVEKESAKMEEVVVTTGVAQKKRKEVASSSTKTTADALEGRVAGVVVNSNSDADAKYKTENKTINTSLQEFNNYVKKNIKPVFDKAGNEIKGIVKLSFKTNKARQPIKIKVTQSLSKKADAQAVELLKNATNWSANNSDRIIVEVVF